MTPTTAIQRAEQWRKEEACGEAEKVAIALLNELQALQAKQEQELIALHAKLAGETLRANHGWQRYEAANKARIEAESELVEARAESAFQKNHMCEYDDCAVAHHDDVIGYKPQAKKWVIEWYRMKDELSRAIPEGHVVVPGWLPIESAPKDGTRFLALHEGRIDFWHWQDFKDGGEAPAGWRNFIHVYPDGGNGPTIWMPLPAAPANKEGT